MRIANRIRATATWLPVLLIAATGLTAQTVTVTPSDVVFSAPPGTTTVPQQNVTLSVAGGFQGFFNSLQQTLEGQGGWLTINPSVGIINGTATLTLGVTNLANISTGIHRIQVQFLNSQGSNQATLIVTLDRTNNARLTSQIGNTLAFTYNPSTGTTDPPFRFSQLTSSVAGQQITFAGPTPNVSWINVVASRNITPADYTVSINPLLLPAGVAASTGTITFTPTSPAGSPLVLTVNVTNTGGGGTGGITINPTSVFYQYTVGGTVPTPQGVSVTSTTGLYTAQVTTGTNFLTVSNNQFGGGTTLLTNQASGTFIYPIVNVAGLAAGQVYSGNIAITNASGGTANLPVQLTVNASGTGTLFATPASLQFTYPTSIADTFVSVSSTGANQSFTASITDCSTGVALFTINQSTNQFTGTTPASLTVGVNTAVAATLAQGATHSCYLRLTPLTGGTPTLVGLGLTVAGGGTGTGNFVVDPATITKTLPAGSSDTGVFVLSSTGSVQTFTIVPTVSWITNINPVNPTISPSSGQYVTFNINTAGLTGAGPHVGTINVTSASGGTRTVTVNVTTTGGTGGFTLTPTPNSVTFNASSGSSAQTQTVQIGVSDNVTTSYTATPTSTGNWLSVTTTGVVPGAISVTANPAGLSIGTHTGTISLTATRTTGSQTIVIPVTLNVTTGSTITLSSSSLSFTHTSGAANPAAQNVSLTTTSSTLIPFSAVANSTGNWLSISPSTGNVSNLSPATLGISVSPSGLAAGTYTGTIQVTGGGATQTLNVSLVVSQPTGPRITQIFNAASFQPTTIAAGQILTISGTNLSATTRSFRLNSQGAVDTQLDNVRVLFDGIPAPLLYISPTQINLIAPYRIATNLTTRIVVESGGVRSDPIDRRVDYAQPGIFTLTQDGTGQGAILNQNSTVNAAGNPAARNSIVQIFMTGEGQTTPPSEDGRISGTDLRRPLRNVVVRIGGRTAEVLYAGSAPGQVAGLAQVNARVPIDTPAGNVSVEIEIGEFRSQANVTLAVSSQVQ